jgi:hypothetical protein
MLRGVLEGLTDFLYGNMEKVRSLLFVIFFYLLYLRE